MPFFSLDRDIVFIPEERPVYLYGEFPDFYALLEVRRSASHSNLENAILEAGSQLLAASLARGRSDRVRLLEYYLPLLRRVLLDATMRTRYNTLLKRHQDGHASQDEAVEFFALLWIQENGAKEREQAASNSPLRRFWRRTRQSA